MSVEFDREHLRSLCSKQQERRLTRDRLIVTLRRVGVPVKDLMADTGLTRRRIEQIIGASK